MQASWDGKAAAAAAAAAAFLFRRSSPFGRRRRRRRKREGEGWFFFERTRDFALAASEKEERERELPLLLASIHVWNGILHEENLLYLSLEGTMPSKYLSFFMYCTVFHTVKTHCRFPPLVDCVWDGRGIAASPIFSWKKWPQLLFLGGGGYCAVTWGRRRLEEEEGTGGKRDDQTWFGWGGERNGA